MHLYEVTSLCLLEFTMISEIHLSDETQKIQSNQKSDHSRSLSRDLKIIGNYMVKFSLTAVFHKRLFLIH